MSLVVLAFIIPAFWPLRRRITSFEANLSYIATLSSPPPPPVSSIRRGATDLYRGIWGLRAKGGKAVFLISEHEEEPPEVFSSKTRCG